MHRSVLTAVLRGSDSSTLVLSNCSTLGFTVCCT
jgi:hypothetical protein